MDQGRGREMDEKWEGLWLDDKCYSGLSNKYWAKQSHSNTNSWTTITLWIIPASIWGLILIHNQSQFSSIPCSYIGLLTHGWESMLIVLEKGLTEFMVNISPLRKKNTASSSPRDEELWWWRLSIAQQTRINHKEISHEYKANGTPG